MKRVNGKVAIVTGSGSGIGAACAQMLASEGARVVVADINREGAESVAQAIREAGGEAAGCAVDISLVDSVVDMIRFAVDTFGGLDILHNNAADTRLSSTLDSDIEHMDLEVWNRTMEVNLRGAMLGCKLAVPYMRKRGGGSIINTSSGSANAGALGYTAYAVSKAAIESLTKHMAAQHGKENIRCNAISPGFIQTNVAKVRYPEEMLDMMLSHHLTPRLGTPEDVAACVVYLASTESAFVTGQVISVDGGLLSHQPFYANERQAMMASGSKE
jgi:NAD(P)-dependent dehydrogenase (short-subunit alcohol dehydrogenase family)